MADRRVVVEVNEELLSMEDYPCRAGRKVVFEVYCTGPDLFSAIIKEVSWHVRERMVSEGGDS